jgi:hypothetical protein
MSVEVGRGEDGLGEEEVGELIGDDFSLSVSVGGGGIDVTTEGTMRVEGEDGVPVINGIMNIVMTSVVEGALVDVGSMTGVFCCKARCALGG